MSQPSTSPEQERLERQLEQLTQVRRRLEASIEGRREEIRSQQESLAQLEHGKVPGGFLHTRAFSVALVVASLFVLGGECISWRLARGPMATPAGPPGENQPDFLRLPQGIAAHLLITSTPPGAAVTINDIPEGNTPYFKTVAPYPCQYVVKVLKPGYRPQQKRLHVADFRGQSWEATLTLAAESSAADPPAPHPPTAAPGPGAR